MFVSLFVIIFLLVNTMGLSAHADSLAEKEASSSGTDYLQAAFKEASEEFHVPLSILMSVSYNETRWEQHNGEPSTSGGYGVMHLTQVENFLADDAKGEGSEQRSSGAASDPDLHTLDKAAKLIGAQPDKLKKDPSLNIRGGAALLAAYEKQTAGKLSDNPADWYGAVAEYSGSQSKETATGFADLVYSTIQQGAERQTSDGSRVQLAPENIKPDKKTAESLHLHKTAATDVDGPKGVDIQFVPALYQPFSKTPGDYGNYDLANRPYDGQDIRYIIIHDAEVSYQGTINTFLSPSYVSAHYVIRSSDGQITEMVRPKDIAWQAGNWYINSHSIGIEHEGYAVQGSTWYSEPMYRASAKLVQYLAKRFNIPLDRQHILGHEEIPGLNPARQRGMHWDPAAYWDWSHYFELLGKPFPSEATDKTNHKDKRLVTISPDYKNNQPELTYNNQPLEPKPSNFVYLYAAPSFDAPLISDPILHPTGFGTTAINDWGDKAVAGRTYYKADSEGDWTAIYYGGQKAWFYNPNGRNATAGQGMLITPEEGKETIPVYGMAYPEASAYEGSGITPAAISPIYSMPAGQVYVSDGLFGSDYYNAKLFNAPETYAVIKGNDQYYQISFNHRIAFVKKSDVDVVK
ncbi:N-acetylmuramoyl-L-alanine amidase [Sporolactobacillus sp. THM7-4]|nr:N-acetylmuramoyl-L-alanine amidase [Sporolactobacillus sp. THM7-4]